MTYMVEPRSRTDIRASAERWRKKYGCDNKLFVPVVKMLDLLSQNDNINYEIVDDEELPKQIHASTNLQDRIILIKQSVYDGACKGIGRDRMTIAHEYGHVALHINDHSSLYRSFNDNQVQVYMNPEWQAKCFAGELLIPHKQTSNMTPEQIANECGVSLEAATYQLSHR